MHNEPYSLPIGELGSSGIGWKMRTMPEDSLRYCPASAGDWGIIRVGLLVPESAMLFVSPSGCGRHGAIAGILNGFMENLFFLCISESEIVNGQHLDKIPEAAREIFREGGDQIKSLLICATCIDTLLASDYESLAEDLSDETGIPVKICHMNPITMDGKAPPPFTVQQAVYGFLTPISKKSEAVNIIGSYGGVMKESEFHWLMRKSGMGEVKHVTTCRTFEEYLEMAGSTLNLLIRPGGRLAAAEMEKNLRIPCHSMPHSYGIETVTSLYKELESVLGMQLPIDNFRESALEAVNAVIRQHGRLRIAVGQSINGGSFEVARALTEFGFEVPYVFADMVIDADRKHVVWLKEHAPNLLVYTNAHTSMVDFQEIGLEADLAIGFDAAYYCSGTKSVPLDMGIQPFGFQSTEYLMSEIEKALEDKSCLKGKMYASGLVI